MNPNRSVRIEPSSLADKQAVLSLREESSSPRGAIRVVIRVIRIKQSVAAGEWNLLPAHTAPSALSAHSSILNRDLPVAFHREPARTTSIDLSRVKPLIIGIAGGSGSGKTTVARRVADALENASVVFIDMDAYYRNFTNLSAEKRKKVNWDHPDAFDLDLFASQIAALADGRTIEKPVYDFTTHARRRETVRIEPADVIVIDGILLFVDRRLRELCDVKVYVDADADIRLIRRVERDLVARGRPLEEILTQYLTTVRPMHLEFVEPSKRWADVIVPQGGHNQVATEMIVAKIQRRLAEQRV
jgi:uridine kinase